MRCERVWYRSAPKRRRFWPILAWEDRGTLTSELGSLTFAGKRSSFVLDLPEIVAVGRCGVDFINEWLTVRDKHGREALFADGSWLGWGGKTESVAAVIEAARPPNDAPG